MPLLERLHELPEVVHPTEESVPLQRDLGDAALFRPPAPAVEEPCGADASVQCLDAVAELGAVHTGDRLEC